MKTQIGLGLAAIGRPQYINVGRQPKDSIDKEAFKKAGTAFIASAYEKGIRYFDVAPGYGIAESMLLDWISREKPVVDVATKWGYTYMANLELDATVHEMKIHTLEKLNEQWNQSKELLPLLKVYQIHSASLDTGVLDSEPILDRLQEIKDSHGIEIGLTTTGERQRDVLEKAMSISRKKEDLLTAFQVTYNVFDQSTEEVCKKLISQGKKVIIKEALANGRVFPNPDFPNYKKAYKYLGQLAKSYEVGIDAIALRFCMQTLAPDIVLSGASDLTHLEENLKANDFTLSEEHINGMKKLAQDPSDYWKERRGLKWV